MLRITSDLASYFFLSAQSPTLLLAHQPLCCSSFTALLPSSVSEFVSPLPGMPPHLHQGLPDNPLSEAFPDRASYNYNVPALAPLPPAHTGAPVHCPSLLEFSQMNCSPSDILHDLPACYLHLPPHWKGNFMTDEEDGLVPSRCSINTVD